MNTEHIAERIRKLGAEAEPGTSCPDEHQTAAALDGQLDAEHRHQFDLHVADCDYCIINLGRLSRQRAERASELVPDITLARANRFARRGGLKRHAPRWAAAALVVLALSFAVNPRLPDGEGPDASDLSLPAAPTPQADFRQSRNINPNSLRPRILIPNEGELFDAVTTRFHWTEIPGSLYYDVRIVTWEGEMVWQERVNDTQWELPDRFELETGVDYYVRVDAYLTEAKSVSSRHILFKVK